MKSTSGAEITYAIGTGRFERSDDRRHVLLRGDATGPLIGSQTLEEFRATVAAATALLHEIDREQCRVLRFPDGKPHRPRRRRAHAASSEASPG